MLLKSNSCSISFIAVQHTNNNCNSNSNKKREINEMKNYTQNIFHYVIFKHAERMKEPREDHERRIEEEAEEN